MRQTARLLSGQLLDPMGQPLANQRLLLTRERKRPTETDFRASTDAQGRFRFANLPAGNFSLSCHLSELPLPPIVDYRISLVQRDITNVVIRVAPGVTVRGRALDGQTGKPRARVPVCRKIIIPGREFVTYYTTDDQGRYEVHLPAKTSCQIALNPDSFSKRTPEKSSIDVIGNAGDVLLRDLRPSDPLPLTGVVIDDLGRPVAGATLKYTGGSPRGIQTDSQGRFTIHETKLGIGFNGTPKSNPSAQTRLLVRHNNLCGEAVVDLRKLEPVKLVASAHYLVTVRGQALSHTGEPLANAAVSLSTLGENGRQEEWLNTNTDQNGQFSLTALPGRKHLVKVNHVRALRASNRRPELPIDEDRVFEIPPTLRPGSTKDLGKIRLSKRAG